jgi:chromosome segregation ATPase
VEFASYDALTAMQQLLSELDAAEREVSEQRVAVDEAERRIGASEQEIVAARENAQRAYGEIRRRENELALLQAAFAPTLARREELLASLDQRRSALGNAQQQRLEGEEQAACIAAALDDLTRSSQESEARCADLRLTIAQLQNELHDLEEHVASERAGHAHLAEQHASFMQALQNLREAEARAAADLRDREHGAIALHEATANAQRELDALAETLAEVRSLAQECEVLAHEGGGRIEEHRAALAHARRRFTQAQERAHALRTSRRGSLEAHLVKLRAAEAEAVHLRVETERAFAWLCAPEPLSAPPDDEPETLDAAPTSVAERLTRGSALFASLAQQHAQKRR